MTTRGKVVVAVMIVCLGGLAIAQDEEIPLSNWGAPPYWTPPLAQTPEGGPGGRMAAHGQGIQAQAEALPSSPLPFVAIQPCRIVDTRQPVLDGFHQPNFGDDEFRTFPLPSSTDCPGLPATAGAWSVNVQFRPISQLSYLTAYPTGTTMPLVSTMTAGPAAWVQNAAIVPAGTGGGIDIYCQYAGRVVIDINGYYGPQSMVTSLNTMSGDLTLAEGSNVTITPGAGTLTIAATAGPGGTLPAGSSSQTLYSNGAGWLASSALTNDGTNVAIANNLLLAGTVSGGTTGVIKVGGDPFLHGYGTGGTFLGTNAGNFSMLGGHNTAVGFESLHSNTLGYFNTATGSNSLTVNSTGYQNTASGYLSLSSNLSGNENTATGSSSMAGNTIGSNNTAVGYYSLNANSTASKNTAVGSGALSAQHFTNGDALWDTHNTAVGYKALAHNEPTSTVNGIMNTAVGSLALTANTTGHANTAIGHQCLNASTEGTENTATGYQSLYSNTTGYQNTAAGSQSLHQNTIGGNNVASGWASLYSNSEGSGNVAIGVSSLDSNTTGAFNIALGYLAGGSLTTGSYNIDIGHQGAAGESNTIRIGSGSQNRTFIAGIRSRTTGVDNAIPVLIDSNGQLGTVSSSIRLKRDVTDMGEASSRLMELRPVTFHYEAHPDGPPHYGLIAEEVELVMPELVVKDAAGQPETVAYHELPAMLLNELQKQQATIQARDARIAALESQQAAQQADIDALKSALAEGDRALERRLAALEQARR